MDLPTHVEAALGIQSPTNVAAIELAADNWSYTQSVFGLTAAEVAVSISEFITSGWTVAKSTPGRPNSSDWKYLEFHCDGILEIFFLATPNNPTTTQTTAAGAALLKAWISDPSIIDNGSIVSGLLLHGKRANATLSNFSDRLASEWIEVCFLAQGSVSIPCWVSKTKIELNQHSKIFNSEANQKYEILLLQSVSEFKNKWRFLSLYRILEHGYLHKVLDTLRSEFFQRPKQALDIAVKTVQNEIKQFIAIIEHPALQRKFLLFKDRFENLATSGNHLAIAIDNSITSADQQGLANQPWEKGVLYFYKIRCAIVHAGTSAPIFDSYTDGPALLEALLPLCEEIAFEYLGIEIS